MTHRRRGQPFSTAGARRIFEPATFSLGTSGDVRGKGRIHGLELVRPGTRDPLPGAQIAQIVAAAQQRGLLVGRNTTTVPHLECVLMIAPPLILSDAEADRLLDIFDQAMAAVFS